MSILTWFLLYLMITQFITASFMMDDWDDLFIYLQVSILFPIWALLQVFYHVVYLMWKKKSKKYYGEYYSTTLIFRENKMKNSTAGKIKFLFKKPVKIEVGKDWHPSTPHPYIIIKSKDK